MEEEYRVFDAFVSKSGSSLIVTVPKAVCGVLKLKEGNIVQIKIKKEGMKK
ncbi:hypothetical protein HQ529_05460 [Candidatus Woesearchaeota archaeon]|nr:hypothetical protein [Candidatus Woesearchaeota archaeon]